MDLKITATAADDNGVVHENTETKPVNANEAAERSEPGRLFYCFLVMLMLF
jgi:hypothetical protein